MTGIAAAAIIARPKRTFRQAIYAERKEVR